MADTLILDNSIWPNGMVTNSDDCDVFSPLGTIKVAVPTSSSDWPKGDKLISPFVYNDGKLVGFVDTKALTVSNNTMICLPYEHIEAEFSSINKGQLQIHAPNATVKKASWANSGKEDIPDVQFKYKGRKTVDEVKTVDVNYLTTDIVDGVWSEPLWDLEQGGDGNWEGGMFSYCSNLESFNSDLSSLTNGTSMFNYCTNLESFTSDLSNLTNGDSMFYGCENLTSFTYDLSKLTDGGHMFRYCPLTTFSSDLSNLTRGNCMFFHCYSLKSFTSDLPSLTSGRFMFSNCENLTSFSSDLSKLSDGESMFCECTTLTSFSSDLSSLTSGRVMFDSCENLTSFSSDLSKLSDGWGMFWECTSLTSFASELSSLTSGYYMFEGCKLDTASVQNIADTINTYNETIHIGIGNSEPNAPEIDAFDKIASKGWTVYVNGSQYTPTSPAAITTLDENGIQTTTPIPYWAKPVPTDEEHARYVDEQGNFFNILGGQFIYGDDVTTYGMFTCEADAAQNMRLTPYTKPQTEIEKQ